MSAADQERVTLTEKASLLSRIKDLEFPPDDQLDAHLRAHLPDILTARRRPTAMDVAMIAAATGVSVEFLIGQDADQPARILGPREREVLVLAANGYSDEEMAELLGLELGAVKYRLSQARVRLRARSTPHAVGKALRLGEIQVGQVM